MQYPAWQADQTLAQLWTKAAIAGSQNKMGVDDATLVKSLKTGANWKSSDWQFVSVESWKAFE